MSRKRQARDMDEVEELADGQKIYVVKKPAGPNLFECSDGLSDALFIVELPPRFRKVLWVRRGSYVIVSPFEAVDGQSGAKTHGEIATVLQPEQIKSWRKRGIWPTHFDAKTEQPDADTSGQTSEPDTENAPDDASDSEEDEYLVNPNRR